MRTKPMFHRHAPAAALLAAAAAAAAPALALAAGPLEIASSMMVEAKSRAADGSTATELVKADRVVPGDRVVFVLSYRNTGAQPLGGVVIANPVPAQLAYRAPAAGTPAPEVSVDGRTYGALSALRVAAADGASRVATADDVTHLRWRLPRPIAPGASGRFAYQAVLK